MSKHPTNRGFTLMEVMITVAVIAILAAIALPSYQDFTIRSKVTECLTLSSAAKLAVAEHVGRAGHASALAASPGSFDPTRYCGDIHVTETGEIVMATRNTGAGEDPVLQLTPTGEGGSLRWTCGLVSGSPRHVPVDCRQPALASNLPAAPPPPPPNAPTAPTAPTAPAPGGSTPEPTPLVGPAAPDGGTPPVPPAAPSDPAPPADPLAPGGVPGGAPDPVPPAEPPATPDPADGGPTPTPAGTPSGDPPAAVPPGRHTDYPSGSREWCLLHPNPPGNQCNQYR